MGEWGCSGDAGTCDFSASPNKFSFFEDFYSTLGSVGTWVGLGQGLDNLRIL